MYPNLLKLVTSVSNILGVSNSVAELLLQECKWNQEQLLAMYFQNPEAALVQAHVTVDPKSNVPAADGDSCFICMDDFSEANGGVFSLVCGHAFHRSVKQYYLVTTCLLTSCLFTCLSAHVYMPATCD